MLPRLGIGAICLLLIAIIGALVWPETSYTRFEPSEAYRAQAERYIVPDFPEDWREHLFTAEDGTILRWGETGNRNSAKATLLIIPGYTATLDMYGEHVDRLARRGYHVMGLDLRGQGRSQRHRADYPEKLWVEDFSVYSDDVAAFLAAHAQNDRPIVPLAMSFGGHVAMRLAIEHPGSVDGLMLLAPALRPKFGDNPERTAGLMRWAKRLGKAKRYAPGQGDWRPVGEDYTVASQALCASDPDRLYLRDAIFTRRPEQRVGGVTMQWGLAFLESADDLARPGRYDEVGLPVHMVMAELDTFVENETIMAACTDLPFCELSQIEGTGHCLMQESDAVLEEMFDDLDALVARIGARP